MGLNKILISIKSFSAIFGFEVGAEYAGDKTYYERYLSAPSWPGLGSGVTIGIGYDLGYHTQAEIRKDWRMHLSEDSVSILCTLSGLRGSIVKEKLTALVKNIHVQYSAAYEVFKMETLPKYARQALVVYPGLELLHPDAIGAIISLVFNRGNDLSDDKSKNHRRQEMAAIKPLIAVKDYAGIASQVRKMKRLWDGIPNYPGATESRATGLINRRENEALLIEHSEHEYNPEDLMVIQL